MLTKESHLPFGDNDVRTRPITCILNTDESVFQLRRDATSDNIEGRLSRGALAF